MTESEVISIGPDTELVLIEFEYDKNAVLELDKFMGSYSNEVMLQYANAEDSLGKFWNKLETECVVGCCGIIAFGLWPEQIAKAVQELDRENLLMELERLRDLVLSSDKQIIGYYRLNQYFAKVSFLSLLDHLITEVSKHV